MQRISFFIATQAITRLKALATVLGGSYAEHIRAAINEYLERKEKK